MEYPTTLTIDAASRCGHKYLHLTKTLHNDDDEIDYFCEICNYKANLCPDCKEQNALKYREVYAAIENPCYHLYTILFKRSWPLWSGTTLSTEWVFIGDDTTRFVVECDIDRHGHKPVGLYKGDHFVPFMGYTVEYMQFLLRHDPEVVQAEDNRRTATVDDWKKYLNVSNGSTFQSVMERLELEVKPGCFTVYPEVLEQCDGD
jgi:hypothetical protein